MTPEEGIGRCTTQRLMPVTARAGRGETYEVYPQFELPGAGFGCGATALARALPATGTVALDGVPAVDWDALRSDLDAAWRERGVCVDWRDVREQMRAPEAVDALIASYLGGDDPLFGRRCALRLDAFFGEEPSHAQPRADALHVLFGPGAALRALAGATRVFVDVPKNEEQFRARAGRVTNLGARRPDAPKAMYKRAYFVDWPLLKAHKAALLPELDWFVDAQDPRQVVFVAGAAFRAALRELSHSTFRPRPWFEPGPWGGHWLEPRVRDACAATPPNLAWSFELIAPENGVVLSDGRLRCEVALEWLLSAHGGEVLGFGHGFFEDEFPIRFDFLDTVGGGNLSLQCHPRPAYIVEEFGERFTQDESYYILDCTPDAAVYLGFQDGIDPAAFRAALERSAATGERVAVEDFVQRHPAAKHDLFLIPHATPHGAGEGNMVLEISATPYIFTFKMYDWLRLDLQGQPRPLNIARAFQNLDFDRRGDAVRAELLSRPRPAGHGEGWTVEELPTHPMHFYAVLRYDLRSGAALELATSDSPLVMMVVEGGAVRVLDPGGREQVFAYAETFVVPAAAGSVRIHNDSAGRVLLVAARLEARDRWPGWMKEAERARG